MATAAAMFAATVAADTRLALFLPHYRNDDERYYYCGAGDYKQYFPHAELIVCRRDESVYSTYKADRNHNVFSPLLALRLLYIITPTTTRAVATAHRAAVHHHEPIV